MAYSWPEVQLPQIAETAIQPLGRVVSSVSQSLSQSQAVRYGRLLRAYRQTIKTPYVAKPFEPPKRADLPDHYQLDHVKLGERHTRLIQSRTLNSRATFILPIGHGTDAAYYQPTIDFYNANNADVRIVELPVLEDNTHFEDGTEITDGYDDVISNGILNDDSPVFEGIPSFHSVYLMPHSSSGQSLERVMFSQPEKAAFALENFEFIYQTGTMLDTANSSHRHNPRLSKLYLKYSEHPNVSPQVAGTTTVDIEWLSGNLGVEDCFFDDIDTHATHGQARLLKLGGIAHFQNVEKALNEGNDLSDFLAVPRVFLHGKEDESACGLTVKDYARMIGFDFYKFCKVGHNPAQNLRIDRAVLRHAFHEVHKKHLTRDELLQAAASASPATRALHAT